MHVLPFVAEEKCFALKGGTAINLFVRPLPRLSVDIDLAYLPVAAREESLQGIEAALRRIEERVTRSIPSAQVRQGRLQGEDTVTKLFVRERRTRIKVDMVRFLLAVRGCLRPNSNEFRGAGTSRSGRWLC